MSISQAEYSRLRTAVETLTKSPGVGTVEIADGQIILALPPLRRHEHASQQIAGQIDAQLLRTHPGYRAHHGAELASIGLGRLLRPDLIVSPENLRRDVPPHEVLLVVEVVSKPNPQRDYHDKVHDYSAMGIPVYLLVDPRTGTGIVHSEPGYECREKFVFGDKITVGPWTLDTSGLLTYA